MCRYIYVCMFIYMRICMHTLCMYECTYVYTVCMYICKTYPHLSLIPKRYVTTA